jgi:DNA uptake protein ComE-like DNA-binding protein
MRFLSVLGAAGAGVFAAAWLDRVQRQRQAGNKGRKVKRVKGVKRGPIDDRLIDGRLNINAASEAEIMSALGLDAETAERIVEHRPYPSKLDLLGRMVVPEEIYLRIKDRIAYKAA